MDKEKKVFKETGFGKFLNGAKDVLPELGNIAVSIVGGNYTGAISSVGKIIKGNKEKNEKTREIASQWEMFKLDYERDVYEMEIADRNSARNREIEIAKTGKIDFMFIITGLSGLFAFLYVIYAVVYVPGVKENSLFVHLLGMVEGVAVTIFAYYFGTSKSSSDKNKMIGK